MKSGGHGMVVHGTAQFSVLSISWLFVLVSSFGCLLSACPLFLPCPVNGSFDISLLLRALHREASLFCCAFVPSPFASVDVSVSVCRSLSFKVAHRFPSGTVCRPLVCIVLLVDHVQHSFDG